MKSIPYSLGLLQALPPMPLSYSKVKSRYNPNDMHTYSLVSHAEAFGKFRTISVLVLM